MGGGGESSWGREGPSEVPGSAGLPAQPCTPPSPGQDVTRPVMWEAWHC